VSIPWYSHLFLVLFFRHAPWMLPDLQTVATEARHEGHHDVAVVEFCGGTQVKLKVELTTTNRRRRV
jgi:hypothetical protein